jgi:hypothetical protein
MADKDHHGQGHTDPSSGGTMDMTEKLEAWLAFWNTAKHAVIGILVLAVLLAIFRTHNGMY